MGKLITLPDGLSATLIKADADIPANPADMVISGQDITCTNIKLSDIANTVTPGEFLTYSLYDLGRHPVINKWSKYRPGTWNKDGVGGSNWLPSGNNSPTFTPKYEYYSSMGDFALYCHSSLVKKPTYYYSYPTGTPYYFEYGITPKLTVSLARGYKDPVCQETGDLSSAWEKVGCWFTVSDTETGSETAVSHIDGGANGIIPRWDAGTPYLGFSSGSLTGFISVGETKWFHIRPYYVSGPHTKVQMIEDGQKVVQCAYTYIRCTGIVLSWTVSTLSSRHRKLVVNYRINRSSGAPSATIDIHGTFTGTDTDSPPYTDDDSSVAIGPGGSYVNGSFTFFFDADDENLVDYPDPDCPNVKVYVRITGSGLPWDNNSLMCNAYPTWSGGSGSG